MAQQLSIPEVNVKTLERLIPYYYEHKEPLCLWGRPSSAKTSVLIQFAQRKAKELGLKYSQTEEGEGIFTHRIIIPSQFDPVDFIGLMKEKDGITYFNPVAAFPRKGQGIITLDEISNADQSIIAPLQNFILTGCLENYKLPKTYWRTAAGNQLTDYCHTNELSLAFYSRLAHFKLEPSLDEVLEYFLQKKRDVRIIAYLKTFPEDLFPSVWDERLLQTVANPFPRTWEKAARLIENIKDLDVVRLIVSSYVGQNCASRFVSFCKVTQKVDIEEIIKNPSKGLAKIIESQDKTSLLYSIISTLAYRWHSCSSVLKPQKIVEIAQVLLDLGCAEFATVFLKMVIRKRTRQLIQTEKFSQLLEKLGVYFDEVN